MAKQSEIKLKYPEARVRALRSVLAKKNIVLEVEMMDYLYQLYKKNVKPEVREFIKEMEEQEEHRTFKRPQAKHRTSIQSTNPIGKDE